MGLSPKASTSPTIRRQALETPLHDIRPIQPAPQSTSVDAAAKKSGVEVKVSDNLDTPQQLASGFAQKGCGLDGFPLCQVARV